MPHKLVVLMLGTVLTAGPMGVPAGPPAMTTGGITSDSGTRWKLDEPKYLSEIARGLLRKRMERHSQDMTELLTAVTLLRYDTAEDVAKRIAAEPRLVRPMPGMADELNRALPDRFFDLQDQLRERARALAVTAAAKNDPALAAGFGRLTETCVACHSTYLRPSTR